MSEVTSASSISSTSGRRMSARASPMRRCSPADSAVVQSASSSSRSMRCIRPATRMAPRISGVGNLGCERRRRQRLTQRAQRKIRPRRQREHAGAGRQPDQAFAERPDAGERAEQRGLARSRRAVDQKPVACRERQIRNAGDPLAALASQHETFQRDILARLMETSIAPCAGAVVSTRCSAVSSCQSRSSAAFHSAMRL